MIKQLRDRYNKRRDNTPYILDAVTRTDGKAMYKRNDNKFEVIRILFAVGDKAYEYYPHYNSIGEDLFIFDTAIEALNFYTDFKIGKVPTESELLGEEW